MRSYIRARGISAEFYARRAAVVAASFWTLGAAPPADLILRGGAVYTSNAARTWVSAVAIADRNILYAGDDRGVAAHLGRNTRVLELQGRMVMPAFHDAHAHPMTGGLRLLRCSLSKIKTPAEAERAIRACAERSSANAWLIGGGASAELFAGASTPRAKLDALVPGRPALFSSEDGFTIWMNTRALERAEIDEKTAAPANGTIDHRAGVLGGEAVILARRKLPPPSAEEYREALRRFSREAHKLGITSVIDANVSPAVLDVYRAMDRAGELELRVRASQAIDPARGLEQVAELVARARESESESRRFRADAAKIFVDGDLEHHTSALLAPYADQPSTRGPLKLDEARLNAMITALDAQNFQVHLHTSGDRAVRAALNSIEGAIAANGPRDRRHQLAHVELVDAAELPRFRRLGVAANLQLFWAADDQPLESVLGKERYRKLHPAASLFASGAVVVAGSDWPSPVMSPLEAMQIALARAEERPRVAELIAAYTIAGAWIAGREAITGSLEPGKAADLIILEKNLFDADPTALGRVAATLLDGVAVHCDEALCAALRKRG